MIFALVLVPTLTGAAAFFIRADHVRRGLLVATALTQAGLTAAAWANRDRHGR
jgi:hypothetical protein